MNISKINTYNNLYKHNTLADNTICVNSKAQPVQSLHQTMSYYNKNAADAITNSKLSEINFTGHAENILIWKSAHSDDIYNAKLEYINEVSKGYSADSGVCNAIKQSGQCSNNAKIVGHVENSDVDFYGPVTKTVYFSDPNERIYNGIKYSYDYVVYAPGAFDDEEEIDASEAYDTVSDWESFGWIDPIGPSWL